MAGHAAGLLCYGLLVGCLAVFNGMADGPAGHRLAAPVQGDIAMPKAPKVVKNISRAREEIAWQKLREELLRHYARQAEMDRRFRDLDGLVVTGPASSKYAGGKGI